DPVVAGTNISYTITVTNNGPSDNQSYQVNLPLPSGTSFVSATTLKCANVSGTVQCTGGPLNPSSDETFNVVLHIASNYAFNQLNNTKSLSATASLAASPAPDPDQPPASTANDSSTVDRDVIAQADLAVGMTASPAGTNLD